MWTRFAAMRTISGPPLVTRLAQKTVSRIALSRMLSSGTEDDTRNGNNEGGSEKPPDSALSRQGIEETSVPHDLFLLI